MQSPTGTDVFMSIANVMAGIARVSRFKDIEDTKFKPVSLGMAKYLDDCHDNNTRFLKLLQPALEETTRVLDGKSHHPFRITIYLCLPQKRPGLDESLLDSLQNTIKDFEYRSRFNIKTEVIREDHDSGMLALAKVRHEIKRDVCDFCLVAGVDSFVSDETVKWLERANHLKCSTNRNGYTPGEAASCILLCNELIADKYDLPVKARILAEASVEEPAFFGSGVPTTGKGLSTAMNQVLKSLPEGEKVNEIFCTLKGLRHEAEEYGYCNLTSGSYMQKPGEFFSLVDCWGDVGSASATSLICYAVIKNELGFADGPNNLIFTLSPGKSRSAALLKTF